MSRKLVDKALQLEAENENQFVSDVIQSIITKNQDGDKDTLLLQVILWKSKDDYEEFIEGMYTLGFTCCDSDLEGTISTKERDPEVVVEWINMLKDSFSDPESIKVLLEKAHDDKNIFMDFVGYDNWERSVYRYDGQLFVDTNPREGAKNSICTKYNNEFYGEPDTPIYAISKYKDKNIVYMPKRIVW